GPFGVARNGDRMLALDYEPSGMGEVSQLYVEEPAGGGGHDLEHSSVNGQRDELKSLTEAHAFINSPTFVGLSVITTDLGQFVDGEPEAASPAALALSVAPNPAASEATVRFELPGPGAVRLTVYDVLGREVARLVDGPLPAGPQAVRLATRGLAPGLYPV